VEPSHRHNLHKTEGFCVPTRHKSRHKPLQTRNSGGKS
jgi:hypothetical protein